MDILKQNIYFLILQFIFKIPLSTCNPKVTETSFSTSSLNYRKLFGGKEKIQDKRNKPVPSTLGTGRRTIPHRETYEEQCEYISKYCLRTYATGRLCGRALFYKYRTFESFCMMEYVNCRERYDLWQIVHMGECYEPKTVTEELHLQYSNDYFMDTYYVPDDQKWEW